MRRAPTLIALVLAVGVLVTGCVTQRNGMGQNKEKQVSTSAEAKQSKVTSAAVPQPGATDSLTGDWSGAIVAAGQSIGIHIHFSKSGEAIAGKIDIPEQGAVGLALSQIKYQPPAVSFQLNAGSDVAAFHGTISADKLSGSFLQGPVSGTFSVTRSASMESASTPGSAGPSEGEGVPIELTTPTGTIYGSLDLPEGRGPFPVALLIAGSGPTDRNGNSPLLNGKNNSLLLIARALREHGIASVRYDKRGVGQSAAAMSSESDLRFSDYANDAASWIELLKHDPRFTKVAVIGHSEGSLVGMVAARTAGADAFVSIAGTGFPAAQILKQQLASQPESIKSQAYAIIDSLEAGREVKQVSPELMPLFRPSVQPYLISWFHYDPQKELSRLSIPILILQGTTDLQVSVKNAEALHEAAPRSTLRIIPGMNHVLKIAPANREENLATYGNPNLPLAPQLVQDLTSFLGSVL